MRAAVDNHTDELNLAISDSAIEKSVFEDPIFQGSDGTFDRIRLENVLRQSGLTEQGFFESRRRDVVRGQLTESMLAGVTPAQGADRHAAHIPG